MTLIVTAAPVAAPITVADARAHLRVTYPDEDALIASLIAAAAARVEAELGAPILVAGYREVLDAWPIAPDGSLGLARGPLVAVDALAVSEGAVSEAAGGWRMLDPATYAPDLGSRPSRIAPVSRLWPAPATGFGGIRMDYRAGFAATPEATPDPLRQAVLALVDDAYARRGETPSAPSAAAEPWLAAFRRGRL